MTHFEEDLKSLEESFFCLDAEPDPDHPKALFSYFEKSKSQQNLISIANRISQDSQQGDRRYIEALKAYYLENREQRSSYVGKLAKLLQKQAELDISVELFLIIGGNHYCHFRFSSFMFGEMAYVVFPNFAMMSVSFR